MAYGKSIGHVSWSIYNNWSQTYLSMFEINFQKWLDYRLGYNIAPIGNGTWSIKRSCDQWHPFMFM